jgi:hypothetical protein
MALDVKEAPATASTLPLAATILAGSSSIALEPIPSVSLSPLTFTAVIFFASTVTLTSTAPP